MKVKVVSLRNLPQITRELASKDPHLAKIVARFGTPPLWAREAGFATLLQIILEQQVSLASAKACYDKLAAHIGDVTPANLLAVDDVDLKTLGFSRQKTAYARHLSEAILDRHIDLDGLHKLPDADARAELVKLKGIGEWTADVYLLMAMLRPDIMPRGDIALHAAYQKLTGAEKRPGTDEFIELAVKWSPFRSVAARLLWHFYLSEKKNGSS